jgi:hypothetical protein
MVYEINSYASSAFGLNAEVVAPGNRWARTVFIQV